MSRPVQTAAIQQGPVEAVDPAMPFQVRGRFFTAVVLKVIGETDAAFHAALDGMMQKSPQFFYNAPIVLDLEQAAGLESKADFLRLARELKTRKLYAVGVQNVTETQSAGAFQAGLVTLKGGGDTNLPQANRQEAATPEASEQPAPASTAASLLITEPVRSGQRIFAEHGDLVVVSSVSSGAELIAHGSIHVYGQLRGRALAGVNGDATARIFCQNLQADLIAIAGLYRTSEDMEPSLVGQRVQAFLREDSLCVEPLK